MPYGYRQKEFIILNCEISKTGSKRHREKVTIRIPLQQWIVLVNKAVNAYDYEPRTERRGRFREK